ncbi:hypothetical protein Rhe02_88600 [Rhizocola hellebori]|uniref:DUF937 domain-containing protein n=2 Tax=Rhizocola hellebori TaxID=1392758 RepID=A0A8J3QK08_9ACTN|nr:YidB family protein [Rhizocola hellebori]GIH10793.1 hypothetical protein Rhe02_88600 [Rhizocola hellebori]
MDLNQIMKLAQDPQMQQLLKGLLGQISKGGGQPNLQGLVNQLQGAGMGDQVQSWVQQGPNQPVSGKQIQDALGTGALDQLASQAGMPPEKAADDLAEVLPVIVDKATPQGQLPTPAPPGTDIDGLLKQLLGGLSQPKS